MNCCNHKPDDGNKHGNKHRGFMSHMWMMLLCCGAPVVIALLLPFIGNLIPGANTVVAKIIPFLCPLMMLMMLPMMMRKDKGEEEQR